MIDSHTQHQFFWQENATLHGQGYLRCPVLLNELVLKQCPDCLSSDSTPETNGSTKATAWSFKIIVSRKERRWTSQKPKNDPHQKHWLMSIVQTQTALKASIRGWCGSTIQFDLVGHFPAPCILYHYNAILPWPSRGTVGSLMSEYYYVHATGRGTRWGRFLPDKLPRQRRASIQ